MSPVVAEIVIGMLLGPNLANFVPLLDGSQGYSEDAYGEYDEYGDGGGGGGGRRLLAGGGGGASLWVYLGQIGVTLLIAESGLHMDFDTIKRVGLSAFGVAILGTGLPIGFGILFMWILKYPIYPDGLAAGCSLAPTSIGIALKLLAEVKQLNSQMGQTIITAAFVDDIMSLVALAILLDLAKGNLTGWGVAAPIVYSILFIAGTGALAYFAFPRAVPWVLKKLPAPKQGAAWSYRDEVLLLFMLATISVYCYVGSFVGSHLLGAFMGGMSFCRIPRSMQVWQHQLKRLNAWLIRIFFACTVGFSVPIDKMMTLDAFWRGMVIAAVPCVLGKLVSGFWLDTRFIVGAAMMGRGEFAYLVAETTRTTPNLGGAEGSTMLSAEAYAAVVWALLVATICAPFLFKFLLNRRFRNQGSVEKPARYWRVTVVRDSDNLASARIGPDTQVALMEALEDHGLDINAIEMSSDATYDYEVYVVVPLLPEAVEKQYQPDYDFLEAKVKEEVEAVVGAGRGVEKWEVQSIAAKENPPLTKEKRNSSLTLTNISFKEDKHLIVQQVQEYVNSPTKKQLSAKQGGRAGSPAPSPLKQGSADDLEGGGGGGH